MQSLNHETIELILIAVTAAAVLLQALVLLAMYVALRKTSRSVLEQIEDFRSSVTPLIDNARGLLERVGPKVEGTAADIADVTHRLRVQAAEVEASAADILERVREQTSRIDEMFSSMLNAVDRAGDYVADAFAQANATSCGRVGVDQGDCRVAAYAHPGAARDIHLPRPRDLYLSIDSGAGVTQSIPRQPPRRRRRRPPTGRG